MTTEKKISIMQAFLDGKEIEYRESGVGKWKVNKDPSWSWGMCEYRVKPPPEFKIDRDKYNKLFKLLKEDYGFDELSFVQLLLDLGDVFDVTIKIE